MLTRIIEVTNSAAKFLRNTKFLRESQMRAKMPRIQYRWPKNYSFFGRHQFGTTEIQQRCFSYPESCMLRKRLVQFGKGSSPVVFFPSRGDGRRGGSTSTKIPLGTIIHNVELKSGKGG